MKHEEQDELWDLLGKAREPKDSPFFSSKVIRAVRAADEPRPGLLAWLRGRWILPVTAGTAAAIVAFFVLHRPADKPDGLAAVPDPLEEMARVASDAPEIPSLDALLASEDHSIWLAADLPSLF